MAVPGDLEVPRHLARDLSELETALSFYGAGAADLGIFLPALKERNTGRDTADRSLGSLSMNRLATPPVRYWYPPTSSTDGAQRFLAVFMRSSSLVEAAKRCGLSDETARTYLKRVRAKLGAPRQMDLARSVHGLLAPNDRGRRFHSDRRGGVTVRGQYRRERDRRERGGPGHVAALFRPHRQVVGALVLFSGIVNVLALAISLFSLQIFDRVLTSQSRDTLYFLTLAAVLAIRLSAILDGVRQHVAQGLGRWLSSRLGPALLAKSLEQRPQGQPGRLDALRNLSVANNFLSTPTLFSVVDMMWVPLYLLVVFLLHPLLGVIAGLGAAVLFILAFLNERGTRARVRDGQALTTANLDYAESLVRNSEVIDAMGMVDATVTHWSARHRQELSANARPQRFSVWITTWARFTRYLVQVALLGGGALLVLDRELTGGAMIAESIIVARLLAPIEAAIGYWKQFVLARQALGRIDRFMGLPAPRPSTMSLPRPTGALAVQGATYVPPALATPVLRGVSFKLHAGELLALVGPSASGKTTLSRLIVGNIRPTQGHVRLDDADVFDWMRADWGPNVGYLPQDVEILPGTVRDNIARFNPDATDDQVVAAAKLADCHGMIMRLDGGYDMVLTDGGLQLSGGQRQRIARRSRRACFAPKAADAGWCSIWRAASSAAFWSARAARSRRARSWSSSTILRARRRTRRSNSPTTPSWLRTRG
ncbi:ATP-binding cassette domain-containing protein [uncultured Sphingomonas sp.]|uniref:ATP-binding cassette domain-containing protein n=1 Tax=uncultured Sphingomonas sp. TaxID=158754 RepID=UPI0035CC7983